MYEGISAEEIAGGSYGAFSGGTGEAYGFSMLASQVSPEELEACGAEVVSLVNKSTSSALARTFEEPTSPLSPLISPRGVNQPRKNFDPRREAEKHSPTAAMEHFYATGSTSPSTVQRPAQTLPPQGGSPVRAKTKHAPGMQSAALGIVVPKLIDDCDREARETRQAIRTILVNQSAGEAGATRAFNAGEESLCRLSNTLAATEKSIFDAETLENFDELQRLCYFHENITAVLNWAAALRDIHKVSYGQLLERNKIQHVYRHVHRMEEIRLAVLSRVSEQTTSRSPLGSPLSDRQGQTSGRGRQIGSVGVHQKYGPFEPHFTKQRVVNLLFINKLQSIFENIIELAIDEALRTQIDIGGVSPAEDNFDALKQSVAVCESEAADPVLRSAQAQTDDSDEVINVGNFDVVSPCGRFAIFRCVQRSFDRYWTEHIVGPGEEFSSNPMMIEKIEPMLTTVETVLVPLSRNFNAFSLVLCAVQKKMIGVFNECADPKKELSASVLTQCISAATWYRGMLESWGFCRHASENDDASAVLADIDNEIMGMLVAAIGGMQEHMSRVAKSCAMELCKNVNKNIRTKPTGALYTNGPIDLFVILQQSLATGMMTASSQGRKITKQLGYACVAAIETYLATCTESCVLTEDDRVRLSRSGTRSLPARVAEELSTWASERLQKLCAFLNDLATVRDNIEIIEERFTSVWPRSDLQRNIQQTSSDGPPVGQREDIIKGRKGAAEEEALKFASPNFEDQQGGGGGLREFTPQSPHAGVNGPSEESPFFSLAAQIMKGSPQFYLNELSKQIEFICASAWRQMFIFGPWCIDDENPLRIILDTAKDFIREDFFTYLQPRFAAMAIVETMRRTVRTYLFNLLLFLQDLPQSKGKDWMKINTTGATMPSPSELAGAYDGPATSNARRQTLLAIMNQQFVSTVFAKNLDRDIYLIQQAFLPFLRPSGRPCDAATARAAALSPLAGIAPAEAEIEVQTVRVVFNFLTAPPARFRSFILQQVLENYPDCPFFIGWLGIERRTDIDTNRKRSLHTAWSELYEQQQGHKERISLLRGIEDVTQLLPNTGEECTNMKKKSNMPSFGKLLNQTGTSNRRHSREILAAIAQQATKTDRYGVFYGVRSERHTSAARGTIGCTTKTTVRSSNDATSPVTHCSSASPKFEHNEMNSPRKMSIPGGSTSDKVEKGKLDDVLGKLNT